ncbi:HpcH/HpaI aldolase family protein [Pikeienuella sp. HZG-20]|uniref:HpcH/HpaI aldolase family protein n=1 Tax=Paludibacillus litoralis TaxID=3133267 RepID=UPI0030EE51D3
MRNAVKLAAEGGKKVRGVQLTIAEPTLIEVLATVGIDFVFLDCEHGPFEMRDIEACCRTSELCGLTVVARAPSCDAATITRLLDRGVNGIVTPHVDSVAEAQAVVDAAYFAPLGKRSFGAGRPHFGFGITDRLAHLAACNSAVSVGIMIESRGGLEDAGEIAALPGVDYVSFGMNDLAQDLGFPGEPQRKEVVDAATEASRKIRAAGKPVRDDFMSVAWVNEILVAGAKQLLG